MTQTINPISIEIGDLLVTYKPAGYNTHSPDYGKKGFLEMWEDLLNKKLYVVHRLDKGTSGVLLIAQTSEAAKEISALFEKHQIHKRYLFLTDKDVSREDRSYKSHIFKDKNEFKSSTAEEANAETQFSFVKQIGNHYLWQAFPKTGKPHQIRLHAEALGMPILGDQDHGGSPWPHLCLHAEHIHFEIDGVPISATAPLPHWAEHPLTPDEARLCLALDRREFLFGWKTLSEQCFRLSHLDNEDYRLDQYGPLWWVYWYKEQDPDAAELALFKKWGDFYGKKVLVRKMLNRGEDPNAQVLWNLHQAPERWQAYEGPVCYELRSDTGLSPGLFLDQRVNRQWLRETSKEKSILNLFSYTSGFSVCAALSEAPIVASVDVSQNFIEWSKQNFKLNHLDPEKFEFWVNDVMLFLKGTIRRKRKFDIIICDPPSFGRSKEGVFSLAKEWELLLTNCLFVLNRGGFILFSNNYEQWDLQGMRKSIAQVIGRQFSIDIQDVPTGLWDFETPDEEPLMKALRIRKK